MKDYTEFCRLTEDERTYLQNTKILLRGQLRALEDALRQEGLQAEIKPLITDLLKDLETCPDKEVEE